MNMRMRSRLLAGRLEAPRAALLALIALVMLLAGCAHEVPAAGPSFLYDPKAPTAPPARPELKLSPDDRILVLSPHPDDEVLATGGLVQQALAKNLPVEVLFLTNGDNNEFAFLYFSKAFTLDAKSAVHAGQVRAFEALRAGRELGLKNGDELFLGYPDFGTLEIWENRWGPDREAFRSMFSEEASVPYWFAQTPGAPYKGEAILADLTDTIREFKPTKIFVSHPGDTNPDHVAYGLYLRTALWDLKDVVQPEVYNFLTHYGEWPQPRGLYFDAPHEPPAQFDELDRWVTLPLQPDQVRRKLDALKRHKTQFDASREYLESYMRGNELFDRFEEIALTPDSPAVTILPSGRAVAGSTPPADSPAVGLPRFARVEGTDLVLGVPSADWQGAVRLMGHRADRPFEEMPKIAVNLRAGDDYSVSERKAWVAPDSVQVTREEGLTELRVPLALLGNPERLHLNMEIKPAEGPLDPMPWVALTLPQP